MTAKLNNRMIWFLEVHAIFITWRNFFWFRSSQIEQSRNAIFAAILSRFWSRLLLFVLTQKFTHLFTLFAASRQKTCLRQRSRGRQSRLAVWHQMCSGWWVIIGETSVADFGAMRRRFDIWRRQILGGQKGESILKLEKRKLKRKDPWN